APPQPGGAPMAPRAPAREETEEGEEPDAADEAPADENEASAPSGGDAAEQKAKAVRLGKKLRRKAMAKEHPPAEA
ncbi:MAG: hypothetical protein AB7F74_19495, partial [Parvibaculaceae bacterium]